MSTVCCYIQNDKQLFGTVSQFQISDSVYLSALDRLEELIAKSNGAPEQKVFENAHKALIDMKSSAHKRVHSYKHPGAYCHPNSKNEWYQWNLMPTGWGNALQLIPGTEEQLYTQWEHLHALVKACEPLKSVLKHKAPQFFHVQQAQGVEGLLNWIERDIPKNFHPKNRHQYKYLISAFDPLDYHRSTSAFAVLMCNGTQVGFMDDNKKAGPVGNARLFESKAAAERTAKAAKFGDGAGGRGPAIIVQLEVRAQRIAFTSGHKEVGGSLQAHFAQLEAKAIEQALQESSVQALLSRLQSVDPKAYEKIQNQIQQSDASDGDSGKAPEHAQVSTNISMPDEQLQKTYAHLIDACVQNLGGYAHWHQYTDADTHQRQPSYAMGYYDKHRHLGRISGASFEVDEKKARRQIEATWGNAQGAGVYAQIRPCALVGTLGTVPEYEVLRQYVDQMQAMHQKKLMEQTQSTDIVRVIEQQLQNSTSAPSSAPAKVRRI